MTKRCFRTRGACAVFLGVGQKNSQTSLRKYKEESRKSMFNRATFLLGRGKYFWFYKIRVFCRCRSPETWWLQFEVAIRTVIAYVGLELGRTTAHSSVDPRGGHPKSGPKLFWNCCLPKFFKSILPGNPFALPFLSNRGR